MKLKKSNFLKYFAVFLLTLVICHFVWGYTKVIQKYLISPLSKSEVEVGHYKLDIRSPGYLGRWKDKQGDLLLFGRVNIGPVFADRLVFRDQGVRIYTTQRNVSGHIEILYDSDGFHLPKSGTLTDCGELGFSNEIHVCGYMDNSVSFVFLDEYHGIFSDGPDVLQLVDFVEYNKNGY